MFEEIPNRKPYFLALNISSPLSAMVKYGAALEYRNRRVSYIPGYYKYTGAYFGKHYDMEFRFYTGKLWRHTERRDFTRQDFFYMRGIFGSMGYNGEKFAFLGQVEKKYSLAEEYAGGAAGFGRRYRKGVLFASIKAGVRAVKLFDLESGQRSLYRNYFVTGPGSIIEVNMHFGINI